MNFYTCPRLTFLKKNDTENAYKSISEPLYFKILWGGGGGACCPTPLAAQTPLAAHAFGAQNLPRLVLKSGYGPEQTQKPISHGFLQISLETELLEYSSAFFDPLGSFTDSDSQLNPAINQGPI